MIDNQQDAETALFKDMGKFWHDPLGHVMYSYPWGEKNTTISEKIGPDEWQRGILSSIGAKLVSGEVKSLGQALAVLEATASGHGVGKSCVVAWLILWAMSTQEDTRGVVTANTESQLKTKTWPELNKWYNMFIAKHWFKLTATALYSVDPEHEKLWRFDMIPWNEEKPEAFAGLHNQGSRILIIYDEASAIPDVIWETSEGALTDTDTEIIWCAFGNPTKNIGRFRECFESLKHRWGTRHVDSRDVKITNKTQIEAWISDYGEDSDFVRIRVKGQFPRAGSQQLIDIDTIVDSFRREPKPSMYDPMILGVDVARFGDDESVIAVRKGRDGKTHPPHRFRGLNTMQLATKVSELWKTYAADAVFVDGGGVGGGVVDRLRDLKVPVIEVNFGGKPDKMTTDGAHNKYYNKRAEMWGNLRDAMVAGLALPESSELRIQLQQQTYEFRTIRGGDAIILTSKEAMKSDGMESPDIADAYALTYAYPVQVDPRKFGGYMHKNRPNLTSDYNPFDVDENLTHRKGENHEFDGKF